MRKSKPESSDVDEGSAAREEPSGPSRAGRLTPLDIQQIEFRRSFKGYDEREVDEFLDRLTEDFAAALDEAQRLRERAEGGLGAVVAGGTPTGSKRTADEIVQRARDDAARIVREAQERATAIGAAALGPGTSREAAVSGAGDRATIAPFIAKEREFLTSLATLVQGHAEAVRGMASSAQKAGAPPAPAQEAGPRPGTTATGTGTGATTGTGTEMGKQPGQRAPEPRRASTATPTRPTSQPASSPATPPATTPAAPPATQPMPAAMPTPSTERTARNPETGRPAKPSEGSSDSGGSAAPTPPGEGHVTIPDPDPAGAKRGEHKLAEGDPSLRELFWGEE
jgi:cell division initiation protein